ncbi:MAG: hypothetical protein WD000_06630, partial [Thermodesulfobacteriota bacterium]
DSAFNCSNGKLDLENSECTAEDIFKPRCNGYSCRNVNDPDDDFGFSLFRFDCEVIDCNTLSCIDNETEIVTDFTDIVALSSKEFSTLLNSDVNEEFNCILTIAN